eukprot:1111585-Rhodomonas_salina.1
MLYKSTRIHSYPVQLYPNLTPFRLQVLPQMLQVFSFLDKTASAKLGEEKALSKMPDGSIACAHDDIAQVWYPKRPPESKG